MDSKPAFTNKDEKIRTERVQNFTSNMVPSRMGEVFKDRGITYSLMVALRYLS